MLDIALERLGWELVGRWKDEMVRNGQWVTGRTGDSFRVEVEGDDESGCVVMRVYGAVWTGTLERGRKPGKVPYGFHKIIARWAANKGITSGWRKRDIERFAWFTAQKIAREGSALYRAGGGSGTIEVPLDWFMGELERLTRGAYVKRVERSV